MLFSCQIWPSNSTYNRLGSECNCFQFLLTCNFYNFYPNNGNKMTKIGRIFSFGNLFVFHIRNIRMLCVHCYTKETIMNCYEFHTRQLRVNVHTIVAVKCDSCVPSCTKITKLSIKTCNHLQ